ncbi:MAG: hypothetical protein JWP75_1075 [Frondihabitans sp.]|nr:hypothetical protein [Frondihabitans sp.]
MVVELHSARVRWRRMLHWAAGHEVLIDRLRPVALRRCGHSIGDRCIIFSGLRVLGENSFSLGQGSFINHDCCIDASAPVTIGRLVSFGPGVMVLSSTHAIGPGSQRAGKRLLLPVTIGDGAWIGARATVLPGVTIGEGCVVAAGAIVTKDCLPNTLYVGAPARAVRTLH